MVNLPSNARCRVSADKDNAWSLEADLLASILNSLNGLMWSMGGAKPGQEPKLVGPSWMVKHKAANSIVMTAEELMAELSKPRTTEGVKNA